MSKLLLIGFTSEKTFRHTVSYVRAHHAEVDVLDLSLLKESQQRLKIEESANDLSVTLEDHVFRFSAYQSFYNRAYWTDLEDPLRNAALSRLIKAIMAWLANSDGMVVNRPGCGSSNCNKFIHGLELRSVGFATPDTYLIGDPVSAGLFVQNGFEVVSKSCSSTKTRTIAVDSRLWERVDTLAYCPSMFQRRVYGDEVRVHWLDGLVLAERIKSSRVDYRFADPNCRANSYCICDIPDNIAKLCDIYCRSQALMFAGFDFKVTSDEQWFVLEANSMPGYESYDRRQGNRIAKALLALLLSEKTAPDTPPRVALAPAWANFLEPRSMSVGEIPEDAHLYDKAISDGNESIRDNLFVTEERRPRTTPFSEPKLDGVFGI